MPVFKYVAVDKQGQTRKGLLEGDSANQVRDMLRHQELIPIEVDESSSKEKSGAGSLFFLNRKISSADLALITYQFSTLISAGLPVEEALLNMAEQSEKSHVKNILLGVHGKILEGNSLASSLDCYPSSFSKLYRASVEAGEKSGQLTDVLARLADYLETQQNVQQKIVQALIYPALLTLISITIVAFLLVYVVPRIVTVFSSTGQSLPGVTIFLLSISSALKNYGIYGLIVIVVGFFVVRWLLRRKHIRYQYHSLLLIIPLIGSTIKTVNAARFSRTFGMLFAASVPVLEAMHAANSVLNLLPMQSAIDRAIKLVGEGKSIHFSLEQTGFFSKLTTRLIAAGEMSGNVETMLEKSASYQERIVTRRIDITLSLFEPGMILFMGGVVLFIVLAILLPIFEINQLVD